MSQYVKNSNTTINYTYNGAGKLVKKTLSGGTARILYYDRSKLAGENVNGETIGYWYDLEGIGGFHYKGEKYYFIKDAQSNVFGLMKNKMIVAKY